MEKEACDKRLNLNLSQKVLPVHLFSIRMQWPGIRGVFIQEAIFVLQHCSNFGHMSNVSFTNGILFYIAYLRLVLI